jgi:Peptidase family M23
MLISRILIISLLLFNYSGDNTKKKDLFISPLKIPLFLSSNFGELRADHFHSGLDIKTQGVTGKEVVATASGYVYAITVSPGGFGKALYIRHPSGYSTVYGHLEKFNDKIDEYVKSVQYEKKRFLVTLYPTSDKFPVRQGEIIAFSGNSGSSGGPHLHYEIRKSEGEIPVNPLLFDFGASDNIKPVIEKLVVYPANRNTLINNQNRKKWINVTGANGNFAIPSDTEINISGSAGFGIKAYDLIDEGTNRCSVYSIELRIDSTCLFKYVMDSFSFSESRYINSHIDYDAYQRDNVFIERTFVLPNDKLSVYKTLVNRGICKFNDDRVHTGEIIVTDIHGNRSLLSFRINAQLMKPADVQIQTDENLVLMPYGKSNSFEAEGVKINIPSGALYDTVYFSYKKGAREKGMLSELHYINDKYTPVHLPYTLAIKPDTIPNGRKSKMLLVRLDDDHKKNAVNSSWSDGYLTADVRSFGNYYAGMDTIAPEISANGLVQGINLTGRKSIIIKITDDLSGINYYEPSIDGKWALFEYDQKNNIIIYRFDPQRITQGTKHNLSLKVADNRDNISYFNCSFTW